MGNPPINIFNVNVQPPQNQAPNQQQQQNPQQPQPPRERRFVPILAGIGGGIGGAAVGFLGGLLAAGIVRSTGHYEFAAYVPYIASLVTGIAAYSSCYTNYYNRLNRQR